MSGELAVFGLLSIVLVGAALAVVLTKNLFHSVLWLALALTATAGIFLTLDAEFLAAVQLLLYAGGVVTIAVFAIVVTERLVAERLTHASRNIAGGAIVAAALAAIVLATVRRVPGGDRPDMPVDLTRTIGDAILIDHSLPFELLAVLLLVALIGAIYFAKPGD